ncbi:MAG: NAD(P)H-hydrate epimerase, partial [Alphaproteobacteria bacterium]|nr:NAD(P)H-hydrate epimerase [Alphaproteobacteria bacterium]
MAKCLLGSKKFDQHLLVTVEDMVSIEHKTVKETKISFYDLMERSGKAVSKEILDHFPKPQKTIVLCGPGNNGGDGFVVARFLKEAGWPVTVAIPPAYGRWSDSATAHKALWTEKCTDLNPEITSGFDIIIDGLFGIGLDRPLKEPYVDIIKTANQQKAFRVSIDIPSGIDGATGALLGVAFNADLTVTFGHKKLGHALLPGRSHTGICKIHDIGFVAPDDTQRKIYLNHPDLWKSAYPYPKIEGHKYTRGHGVILGGSTFTGAARLAAMAARRIGAGLISIATSPEAQEIYATSSPGILLSILAHTHDFEELVKDDRKNAYLLGPGF